MATLVPLHLLLALVTASHVTVSLLKKDVASAAKSLFAEWIASGLVAQHTAATYHRTAEYRNQSIDSLTQSVSLVHLHINLYNSHA